MPTVEQVRDRDRIEQFLRRDCWSHLYALADLDDFFWSDTTWFATTSGGTVFAVAFLFEKLSPPVLYAVCPPGHGPTRELLQAIRGEFPPVFFATLGTHLEGVFDREYSFQSAGEHFKMILKDSESLPGEEHIQAERLTKAHLEELQTFYRERAYLPEEAPGRFFEPYMLEQWPYFGIRESGRLVSAGGVHVLSDTYGVTALGNIATRPDCRGRRLGRAITLALCHELRDRVPLIGLNVQSSNAAAIRCYGQLGFHIHCRYCEGTFCCQKES